MNEVLSIEDAKQVFSAGVSYALGYIQNHYLELPEGKFDIPDSEIWGVKLRYDTSLISEQLTYERHRNVVDLHVTLSGEENSFFFAGDKGIITKEYDPKNDYELVTYIPKNRTLIPEGHCIAFDQNYCHATGFHEQKITVEKVVLKVPTSSL